MKHIELGCKLMDEKYKHILEFGVFKGTTLKIIRDFFPKKYEVFGFDSFEGLPEDWVDSNNNIAGDGICVKGFFSTDKSIPDIEGVTIYDGWFEDTIPEYLNVAETIGLLHVDCDLYSSTKTLLYSLNNYIKPNTIIVFDEWFYYSGGNDRNDDHEQKCFYEWVKDFNREYELINHYSDTSTNEQQIVKILK
jgi:hypothetical protein